MYSVIFAIFCVGHRYLIRFFSRFSVSDTEILFNSLRDCLCRTQTSYSVIFAIFSVGHRQLNRISSRFFCLRLRRLIPFMLISDLSTLKYIDHELGYDLSDS